MNPDRYKIIYNRKYDNNDNVFDKSSNTTTAVVIPSTSTSYSPIKDHQNYYYNKYHEGLLELAKGFFNILSSQLLNKTMVAAVK
jgi:hypothetical protein